MSESCIAPFEIKEGDLVAYVDGEATLAIMAHIARCPACRAEVESLRQFQILFRQALHSAPTAASAERGPLSDRPTSGNVLETLPVWSARLHQAQKRPSPQDPKLGWTMALALTQPVRRFFWAGAAGGLVLLVLAALYYGPFLAPQNVTPSLAVENPAAPAVVREAAAPDVNRALLTRFEPDAPPEIAEIRTAMPPETAPSESRIHQMIRRRIIDVSVGAQIIVEEKLAIAPPLDLRRALTVKSRTIPAARLLRPSSAAGYRVESSTVDKKGQRYVVWADNYHGLTTLYFAHSPNAGRTWSRAVKIDDGVGRIFNPHLAIDDRGRLYVVWQNWHGVDRHDFYFARSTDSGQRWSEVVRVDNTTGETFNPNLAINADGELALTWQNRSRAATGVYFIRSTDGGQTWSAKVRAANIGS